MYETINLLLQETRFIRDFFYLFLREKRLTGEHLFVSAEGQRMSVSEGLAAGLHLYLFAQIPDINESPWIFPP